MFYAYIVCQKSKTDINMANKEEALRRRAVSLHEQGMKIVDIARKTGRSRQWVHKWIARHKEGSGDWSASKSRAPRRKPGKTSVALEGKVIEARKSLEASPHLEWGAYAIWHRLKDSGVDAPSVATINRILRRHGMTSGKPEYSKSGIDYPETPSGTQIMDLIGPRYISGGRRYFLLTIISNDTRHAGVYPLPSKSADEITRGVVSFWKSYTTPGFLQMDNELSFKGSNRHPRALGMLLRTAMSLNVVPVFIPVGEPWRNGVVERFNQTVQRTLLTQRHSDFEQLLEHSQEFVDTHNNSHHYSTLQHKTPFQLDKELSVELSPLNGEYLPSERPCLERGNINEIRFIRLVRSNLRISVLNTDIPVPPQLVHSYVVARLLVNENRLLITQDGRTIQSVDFQMHFL